MMSYISLVSTIIRNSNKKGENMEIFLTSISGILVILGMILVGFVMGEKGWFDDKSRGLIAKLVTQIALPCYMLYTHYTAFHSSRPT